MMDQKNSVDSLISQTFYRVGSVVVIVSFFLPWGATGKFFGIDASVSGFSLVQTIFQMFDTSLFKSGEVTIIVAATLVFLLSPICCHAISLLQLLAQSLPSKLILVFPLVVWILEGLYLLLRTEGELLRGTRVCQRWFDWHVVGMLIAAFPLLPVDKSALANKMRRTTLHKSFASSAERV